jgi:hypothetical protein
MVIADYLGDGLTKYMGDAARCWYVYLIMAGISFAICIIYLILLRCFAKPILYISFVLILALLGGGGAYVYAQQYRYAEGDNT